ncbi:RNA polymerase sigma factor [Actinomadura graeca]|uniref:RNA polymerase sigma factor n=1 Tax=Actinomadura graeca TaxID=2750812 RepID=A0ABX8R474_9ACTN|nr:RNA polymerase sigma factor [Actinomadura graeca]QXJ25859.1 RNA polymerase sigma factor [Actinomadura graeca]
MPEHMAISSSMAAFEQYYRADIKPLIGFVIYLGATEHEAQDIAQEAMKAALLSWPAIEHPKAFTRTVAQRQLRRSRAKVQNETQALVSRTGPGGLAAAGTHTDEGLRQYLLQLLSLLPTEQRTVMAWTIDGFTPAEIAELTGHKPATVRSHLRHARKRLTQELTGQEGGRHGP